MGVTTTTETISFTEACQQLPTTFGAIFTSEGLGSLFSDASKIPLVLVTIFSFSLSDTFDTIGTFIGTGRRTGIFSDQDEKTMETSVGFKSKMDKALFADATATSIGAILGTSNTTTYVESAAGIGAGGRTGLTSVVVALCFAVSAFLATFVSAIPFAATAPALVVVGIMMLSAFKEIKWDDFDEAIVRYMRKKHNLLIGERTAEDIKIKIGTCFPLAQNETMDVRGRNLVTGLPKTVTVSSEETEEALREPTLQIVEAVHSVLEKTPPELAADVADRGIVLTGGGALLRGLEELIEDRTGINTMTADDPMTCVAIGTGKYVEFLSGKRDDD